MNPNTSRTVLIVLACLVAVGIGGYFVFAQTMPQSVAAPVASSTQQTNNTPSPAPVTTTPAPTPTPVPTPVPPTSVKMITQADNGKTVVLTKGQRFGVAFGDTLQWDLAFDPLGIVTRVTNIATLKGEQGVYTATAAGTTTLNASGRPICKPYEACAQFIQEVKVTIIVK